MRFLASRPARSLVRCRGQCPLAAALRRLVCLATAATLGSWALPSRAASPVPPLLAVTGSLAAVPEYSAKAGYLLLFTRYVDWPAASFTGPEAPVVIGILGPNPFGEVLERTVQGLRSNGRPIVVRQLGDAAEAADCHIVFISRLAEPRQLARLRELAGKPVLTVGEAGDAQSAAVMVQFATNREAARTKLVFEVDLATAEAANLRISSPMLVAARKVSRAKPRREAAR